MYTSVRYGSKPTVLIPTWNKWNIPNFVKLLQFSSLIFISVAGSRYWDKVKAVWGVTPKV